MIDINSDGLIDIIYKDGTSIMAHLNNGNGFNEALDLSIQDVEGISRNVSYNFSAHGSGTFGVPIMLVKITTSIYADYTYSFNNEKLRFMDINGDGAIDILYEDNNNCHVKYGNPLKQNILKTVVTPSLAEYEIGYSRINSDINNPCSKWVMSQLTVSDNDNGYDDGYDNMYYKFEYSGMKYHRIERESYGFAEVTTSIVSDFSPEATVLRRHRELFHTENGRLHGLKYRDEITDGEETLLSASSYKWTLNDINTGEVVSRPQCGDFYPRLMAETTTDFGSNSENTITSTKRYEYTKFGNISQYVNKFKHNDSITANMTYTPNTSRNFLDELTEMTALSKDQETVIRKLKRTYNDYGKIASVLNYYSPEGVPCITDFSYDNYGNISRVDFPANATGQSAHREYTYEASLNAHLASVTDQFGLVTTYSNYDYRFAKPCRVTAPNGTTTQYSYYSDGKLASVKFPSDLAYSAKFTYWDEINSNNPNRWARIEKHDTVISGNSFITQTVCDGLGRTLQTAKKAVVNGRTKFVVSGKNIYDEYGRVSVKYHPLTTTQSREGFIISDNFNNPTSYTYDCLDRVISTTTPDNITVTQSYDVSIDANSDSATLVTTTYPLGRIIMSYYDSRGLPTTTTSVRNAGNATTKFSYSPMGETLSSIDPENHETSYQYDMLGRLTMRNHPDAGTTTYRYDNAGNLVEKSTQKLLDRSSSITYSYNFDRLTEIQYPDNPQMGVSYIYGTSGLGIGRVVLRQDGVGVQSYSYDKMGNVVRNIRTYAIPQGDLITFETKWKYDTWGRTLEMTYPDGETVTYGYDFAGNAKTLNAGGSSIVSNIKYDKFGNRILISYGNGAYNQYLYDDHSLQLTNLCSYDASGAIMQNLNYTYDAIYNITRITDAAGNFSYSYEYDTLNRIIESTGRGTDGNNTPNYNFEMSYSPSGRILNCSLSGDKSICGQSSSMNINESYSYANTSHPHAISSKRPQNPLFSEAYTWDANGNLKGNSGINNPYRRQIYHNEENRLAAVGDWPARAQFNSTATGHLDAYLYDADGERIWKLYGTSTTTYNNGTQTSNDAELAKTFYPTPQISIDKQNFFKHYFVGSERICSAKGILTQTSANTPNHLSFINTNAQTFANGILVQIANALDSIGFDGQISIDTAFQCVSRRQGNDGPPFEQNPILTPAKSADATLPIFPPVPALQSEFYYYHYNHQGSVALVTWHNGTIRQHLQYLPYGGIFVDHRTGSYSSTYTFSAKEKDSESGYTYFGARYYSDNIMQWLSVDPMSDERPGVSPYSYCQNNPIGRVDMWGMLDEIVIRGMDGSKTTYVPGMSSEGYDEFTAQVINNYNTAYSKSETAREDIDNLVNAKGTYLVRKGDSGFRGNENLDKTKYGSINWNPEGNEVSVQRDENSLSTELEINPLSGLIHETIHASRWEQGISILDGSRKRGTLNEEISTMHRENMFRAEMGYKIRTHHEIEGQQGSGYPMLRFHSSETGTISNYLWQNNHHQIYKYK